MTNILTQVARHIEISSTSKTKSLQQKRAKRAIKMWTASVWTGVAKPDTLIFDMWQHVSRCCLLVDRIPNVNDYFTFCNRLVYVLDMYLDLYYKKKYTCCLPFSTGYTAKYCNAVITQIETLNWRRSSSLACLICFLVSDSKHMVKEIRECFLQCYIFGC